MNWEEIQPKANSVRSALIRIMEGMLSRRKEWGLTPEAPLFTRAKERLESPEFNIVVCGEVKRGKSTFINAILGKRLLPTGVGETTSQVFRVTNAETESFALEFVDGKRESITRDELVRYGSQTAADLEGEPLFSGRTLKWIDIRTKAAFLPAGVHLVDTPGLGALYSAHSVITNAYIAQADIVVFVLDSSKPLVQSEKAFLQKVFAITPNILFVQTKIDMKSKPEWEDLQRRNEELLNEAFGQAGGPAIQVFPVASELLFAAANQSVDVLRDISLSESLFGAAQTALERLMYRVVGWNRSAVAAVQAGNYHQVVTKYFEEQRKMLATTSEEERKRIAQGKQDIGKQFYQDWGEKGIKRFEVKQKVAKILGSVRTKASAIGSRGSPLYKKFSDLLDGASGMDELKCIGARLASELTDAYAEEWSAIVEDAITKVEEELKGYSVSVTGGDVTVDDLSSGAGNGGGFYSRIRGTYMGAATGFGIVGMGAFLLGTAASGGLLAVAAIIGGVIGTIFNRKDELQKAKTELKVQMNELSGVLHNKIVLPQGDKDSLVDQFIENVNAGMSDALKQLYEFEKARHEQQVQTLEEQATLNAQQSQEALGMMRNRMELWAAVGKELQDETAKLRQVQEALG